MFKVLKHFVTKVKDRSESCYILIKYYILTRIHLNYSTLITNNAIIFTLLKTSVKVDIYYNLKLRV